MNYTILSEMKHLSDETKNMAAVSILDNICRQNNESEKFKKTLMAINMLNEEDLLQLLEIAKNDFRKEEELYEQINSRSTSEKEKMEAEARLESIGDEGIKKMDDILIKYPLSCVPGHNIDVFMRGLGESLVIEEEDIDGSLHGLATEYIFYMMIVAGMSEDELEEHPVYHMLPESLKYMLRDTDYINLSTSRITPPEGRMVSGEGMTI